MEQDLGEFIEDGYLSTSQAGMIRTMLRRLLSEIEPECIPLTDAFNFSDYALGSALGCYDGEVYQKLVEWTKKEPLNANPVSEVYNEFLKPVIQQKLKAKL